MGYKTLELTLISAKDLKNVNLIGKMDVYVVVYLSDDAKHKQKTPVHQDGGTAPSWNYTMRFTIDENAAVKPGKYLVFQLKHEHSFGADKDLGEVLVSLKELLDGVRAKDPSTPQFLTYQVKRSNGKAHGELKFSCKFIDMGQHNNVVVGGGDHSTSKPCSSSNYTSSSSSSYYSAPPPQGVYPPPHGPAAHAYPPHGAAAQAYPPPGGAAAQAYPPPGGAAAQAYPAPGAGYPSSGGYPPPPHKAEEYPPPPHKAGEYPPPPQKAGEYPPQQPPMAVPYQAGPAQGYPAYGGGYPPAPAGAGAGYGYPPPPSGYPGGYPPAGYAAQTQKPQKPKKSNKFGMGLGAGLLGGALGGLVLGEMADDVYDSGYDAGFDDGGFDF